MRKQMRCRLLSALLALVITVGVMPFSVFADETATVSDGFVSIGVSDTTESAEEGSEGSEIVDGFRVSRYSDVSADSPYLDAIERLSDDGIVSGIGDGKFAPDALVTTHQMYIMLCRMLNIDIQWDETAKLAQLGFDSGWMFQTMDAADVNLEIAVCRGFVYQMLFKAFGVQIYDYRLYSDASVSNGGGYPSAMWAAFQFGLCDTDTPGWEQLTRGEAAYLLNWFQMNAASLEMPQPAVMGKLTIENPDDFDITDYLVELDDIPDTILALFTASRYALSLDISHIDAYNQANHVNAVGLFSSQDKRIYVSTSTSVKHEFGHFMDKMQGWISSRYADEIQAGQNYLREYAATDCKEFYAEAFAYYLRWTNRESPARENGLAKMEQYTPRIYEHFVSLEANGWSLNQLAA